MTAYTGFLLVFGATLALLGADLATGLTGRRRAHLVCVAFTVAGLAGSVVLAISFGRAYVFQPIIHGIHRTLATSVVVLVLPMLATGLTILAGRAGARPLHRRFAFLLLGVAVAATLTGVAMKRTATLKPASAPSIGSPP